MLAWKALRAAGGDYVMSDVNLAPRRVWVGLLVPGKKMASLTRELGTELLTLYRGPAHLGLVAGGLGLALVPEGGAAFGPAARNLGKRIQPGILWGAILTDIRDFLKFRFRATGAADHVQVQRFIATGGLPEDHGQWDTAASINFAIATLNQFSKDAPNVEGERRVVVVDGLCDLLLAEANAFLQEYLAPWAYDDESRGLLGRVHESTLDDVNDEVKRIRKARRR